MKCIVHRRFSSAAALELAFGAAFTAVFLLPGRVQGQPQGKDKAKAKAKATAVKTVTIATGLWHPWSLAWLPNGDMLVTERNGKLRRVSDGKLAPEPIAGVPPCSVRLSGLMEVLPHPNWRQNQLVYLTYTKDVGPDLKRRRL